MRRDAPTIRAAVVVRPRLVSYLLPSSRWVGNQASVIGKPAWIQACTPPHSAFTFGEPLNDVSGCPPGGEGLSRSGTVEDDLLVLR